jgi:hypothetical protein
LTLLCEQLDGGGWQQHYTACDLHLVAIGDKASAQRVPKKVDKAPYARFLGSVAKTLSKLGIVGGTNTSLKSKRKSIVNALQIIYRYEYYNDAIAFGESVRESFSKIDNQICCVLHLHKRVIEKVITLVFTRSVEEL